MRESARERESFNDGREQSRTLRLSTLHRGVQPAFTIFYRAGAKELKNAIYYPQFFFFERKTLRGLQWRERVVEKFKYITSRGREIIGFYTEHTTRGRNYRKRGSVPILCVRCARWEREIQRERERERERERDGSDVILIALKLVKKFALFLAKNLHLSFSPLKWRWVHTFRCQSVAPFETVSILRKIRTLCDRFTSVKWRDRGTKHRKKRSNFRLHRPSQRKNESN